MITVRLSGGLGNQMFQYAFARSIAIARKEKLILNISAYNSYKLFKYGLDCYKIECELSNKELLYNNIYVRKAMKVLSAMGMKKYFSYYIEHKLFTYDPDVISSSTKVMLGSWQSFKYFEKISDLIRNDFKLKEDLSYTASIIEANITKYESIALHIRRGDYFSDKRTKKHHGILDLDYFINAIHIINTRVKDPIIYVFSDDIEWVYKNLKCEFPIEFIDNAVGGPEISIYLMSKCKHNIISNSSFSWWGAWLNTNPNKIVIAPKIWFCNQPSTADLIPETWIKI